MTSTKKIIAVVGATGKQGSSVANTFLSLPNWRVRALTRNPSSPKAQELAKAGAELVQADLADRESLSRAFDGVHAVFLNTDFWAPYRSLLESGVAQDVASKQASEVEISHGQNAAAAAAGLTTLERFVYSALGPMNAASQGKYPHSYHWEAKARIAEHIQKEQPELARKTSYIYLGAYSSNPLIMPRANPQTGEYQVLFPGKADTRIPFIDECRTTGFFVRALVEDEEPGAKLLAYDDYPTIGQAMEAWSKITGKPASFQELSLEVIHRVTGIAYEVLDGPAFIAEFGYMAGVEGFIEPPQLKKPVPRKSLEEILRGLPLDYLLGAKVVF
ncbi:hypothetical protein VTK73DRAFT_8665 [Phialemonium thermophilum]|uniref:NmrA-like domain-containing protein n=1 Tax=Phialemonium thermophilum TaxID=223376 RepID=A0ABR3XNN6_9PEZI